MDRALWVLLWLRLRSTLRRSVRSTRTIKGLLLVLVGALLFLPVVAASLLAPRVQLAAQLALIRRYGPLGLLSFCLLNLILSSDERAVYFSQSEVEFLFSGPFRRRQLLVYKMVAGLWSSCLVALLLTLFFAHHAQAFLPAWVGLFLTVELLVLVSMAVGLLISMMGALAFNRRRKLILLGMAGVLAFVLLPSIRAVRAPGIYELIDRLESLPLMRVLVWPFRPAVMAFTAGSLWPELAVSSLLGLVVLAALAGIILVLDAEYYEAAASASARIYARLQARKRGKGITLGYRTAVRLPMLPWCGGAGPMLWRQLATAARFPGRFLFLVFLQVSPLLPMLLVGRLSRDASALDLRFVLTVLASLSLASSMLVGFDFRSDLDGMDTLKALPLSATAVTIGELVVPVLMLSLAQGVCLFLFAGLRGDGSYLPEALLFLVPYNALLVEVEAVLFLWFPFRLVPGSSMDFAIMGRQLLLMLAKLFVLGFTAGIAGASGALLYHYLITGWWTALMVSWLILALFVAALLPFVAGAFQQFDVARDTPP